MAQPKFTLYKYITLKDGSWRYCTAAFYSTAKIKPNRCIVGGKQAEHPEGAYYLYHKKNWIPVGADALEARRRRNAQLDDDEFKRILGTAPVPSPTMSQTSSRIPLEVAAEKYFSNCHKRGLDTKTIRKYRSPTKPSNGQRKNEIASARWCVRDHLGLTPRGQRFSKIPRFTVWYSMTYSWARCPIFVQNAAVWEPLCNYCATKSRSKLRRFRPPSTVANLR